jgi:hypothetical protein
MTNELEKEIGTIEQPRLTAGSVIVKQITIAPPKEGSKAKIVTLHCQHPDKEELVKLNNIKIKKVQGNNETITKDGIWYREDKEGKVDKKCNASELMRFYQKKNLKEFENSSVTTELDAGGYLAIKAY